MINQKNLRPTLIYHFEPNERHVCTVHTYLQLIPIRKEVGAAPDQ
mgnify:CR=1 FL=1